MSEPFVGEIRIVAFNFAPVNWAFCNGQLLPISQNTALFSILGTFYGGNGTSTFALPNLQSRVPIGTGQGAGLSDYVIGETVGTESVTLLSTQMPAHTHTLMSATLNPQNAAQNTPHPGPTAMIGLSGPDALYTNTASSAGPQTMASTSIAIAGGSLPHENRQPVLAMNFIICMYGVFPSRN